LYLPTTNLCAFFLSHFRATRPANCILLDLIILLLLGDGIN
jgi:hypothetical protein